jgi:tetratricopeptide (TPR) repeat protein
MKKLITFLICFNSLFYGYSQQIHSPAEIIKIMSDSKISYEVKALDKTIECKDYSDKLNYHDSYRISTDSGLSTYKITVSERAKPLFDKAESFFQSNQADSALLYYKLSLDADTMLFNVMTYIGQIYGSKGDYINANIWYKKAIKNNFIDYMAHWFLADSYLAMNDLKSAVGEIVIAQILNRNNPRIKKSVINIFEKDRRDTDDWCFNPQIELIKISDKKISVAFTENWLGYAMAKALWKYEPGYRESMGVSQGYYSTIEDKECLISLLVGLENAKIKIKKESQLRILKEAAENKYIEDYILYEIVLPQTPFVAFQLPEQTIMGIKDYILDYRNTK